MAFSLERVVLWGRSFDEYRRMFALSEDDLRYRILGCSDGPASFNADATRQGTHVVSVDPIYGLSPPDIRRGIDTTYPQVMEQTRRNFTNFVWTAFASVEALGRARMDSMERFLADFQTNRHSGRYVAGALPALPFGNQCFELALCSHFLFLYSAQFSEQFHMAAIRELCRVAHEVRVFPLVSLGGEPSPHVSRVSQMLHRVGSRVTIETVAYEFQRGGDQMMRIRSATA